MILRRVITHFRKQEWTAIALDFVIVVVGVFIGIQVSNWNAERIDQRREATFRSGLVRDIRSDISGTADLPLERPGPSMPGRRRQTSAS